MKRRTVLRLVLGGIAAQAPLEAAWASYQSCGGKPVDIDTLRCPDGSIPSYSYGNPPVAPQPKKPDGNPLPDNKFKFVGVWHTQQEGISYGHSFDTPGATQMSGKFSLRPGDLTLDQNGAFVWNTQDGLFGRWISLNGAGDYGRDKPLAFRPGSSDIQNSAPTTRRPEPYFEDTKWDFILMIASGKTWRGKVDPDGRLRLRLDDQHVVFGTR